jgi:hypothetical protein
VQKPARAAAPAPAPPQNGAVRIQTNPPWAKVYIDNIERGTTPAITLFPLSAGPHKIRIVKDGFAEYADSLTIRGSDTVLLRIQLPQ